MRVGSQAEHVSSSQTARVHVRDGDSANKLPIMLHNQDRYATVGVSPVYIWALALAEAEVT